MQNKLDQILENQSVMIGKHEKLDTRVTTVESKLNWYAGGIAAIVGAYTFAGEKIRAAFLGS